MIDIKVLIPARKGSTRIKNKNLQKINELTLIEISVNHALGIGLNDICLYTDIPKELINVSILKYYKERPLETSSNEAKANSYLHSFAKSLKKDTLIVLFQPTSPFRNLKKIKQSIDFFIDKYYNTSTLITSVSLFKENLLEKNKFTFLSPSFPNEPRRQQERSEKFIEDGNFYIFQSNFFLSNGSDITNLDWLGIENEFPYNIDINDNNDLILSNLIYPNLEKFN